MMRTAAIVCALLASCAHTPPTRWAPQIGQAADAASTLAALGAGAVELNPIVGAAPATMALKPLITATIVPRSKTRKECVNAAQFAWHMGAGPAVNNVLVLTGVGAPVAIAGGLISVPLTRTWARRSAEDLCDERWTVYGVGSVPIPQKDRDQMRKMKDL